MNKARKKLLLYTLIAVAALLIVLLGIVNFVNFDMAARDADEITAMLAERGGSFAPENEGGAPSVQPGEKPEGEAPSVQPGEKPEGEAPSGQPGEKPDDIPEVGPAESAPPDGARSESGGRHGSGPENTRMQQMGGPKSPEIASSVRYFTYAFESESAEAEKIAFELSAVGEEEAAAWARSLLREDRGWTSRSYRYRVYEYDGKTYVSIIDQGRELLPSYRILIISAIGGVLGLLISFLILLWASKRLFKPLEDADRKQREFILEAEKDFKLPLTNIGADVELLERAHGPSEETRSIRRQLNGMNALIKNLGSFAVFKDEDGLVSELSLSEFFSAELDTRAKDFEKLGISVKKDIEEGIALKGDPGSIKRLVFEIVDNAAKYSLTHAEFSLNKQGERILLRACNDTELTDGSVNEVFDRFTRLSNAGGEAGAGLGLSAVKEIAKAYSGRADARVEKGVFTLEIAL